MNKPRLKTSGSYRAYTRVFHCVCVCVCVCVCKLRKEIKSLLNSGNACHLSEEDLASSSLLFKNRKFKLYRTITFACFLLGNSPASEVYVPTFRNTRSVPSSPAGTHAERPVKLEQSVPKRRHINSDAGELPKRKHTTFRTWRKFEIKQNAHLLN
jgi:hypothetical protein